MITVLGGALLVLAVARFFLGGSFEFPAICLTITLLRNPLVIVPIAILDTTMTGLLYDSKNIVFV